MPLRYEDRVLVASSTTGTGTFTLGSAIAGHRTFGSAINDGDTVFYRAEEVDGGGIPTGAFEIGYGTYTASGTTLSRDKVLISSGSRATPVIQSVGTVANVDGNATIVTNAPSGVQVGDGLLLLVANGDVAITTPRGWASIVSRLASYGRITALVRIADGTATDTPTLTQGSAVDASAVILRISGIDAIKFFDSFTAASENGPSTFTIPSVISTIANDLIVVAVSHGGNITSDPSGYTQHIRQNLSSTQYGLGVWSKSATTAGTYGGETFTGTAHSCAEFTFAVQAAYSKVSFSNSLRISLIAPASKVGCPDIQIFTSSGVWTKPLWAQDTEIICIGGGGGGGGGRTRNGLSSGGGGAGSGGVITRKFLKASTLNPLETVTVGAAGAGGDGATPSAGTAGGATSFGSWVYAAGGASGGAGGTGAGGAAGAAQGTTGLFQQASLAGGVGSASSTGTAGASATTIQAPGGGGGAGSAAYGSSNGGAGGGFSANSVTVNSVAGGTAGVAATSAGGNGNTLEWLYGIPIGTGGGGGGSHGVNPGPATAYNGGNGAGYGAGGGGGGAATHNATSGTSGNGGNGAPGICVVVSY